MNPDTLPQIAAIVCAWRAYETRKGQLDSGANRLVSEEVAAAMFDLTLSDETGYDAVDRDHMRVQIKGSRPNPGKAPTLVSFYNADFDYALIVHMAPDFTVEAVYRVPRHAAINRWKTTARGTYHLTFSSIRKVGERVYSREGSR